MERGIKDKLEQYEVILRDMRTQNRRSLMYKADNFSHAEEQAVQDFDAGNEEIVTIYKDYEDVNVR